MVTCEVERTVGIREAVDADVTALVALGLRFLRETTYRADVAENPTQMAIFLEMLIAGPQGLVLVADGAGGPVGMIGVLIYTNPLSAEVMASEMFWWMNPEQRGMGVRLLKRAEQWARAQGATKMQVSAPTAAVAQLYERLGYHELERAFQRSLA